jgi:hypothetical protein
MSTEDTEALLLEALARLGQWSDVRDTRRAASNIARERGTAYTAAPGTTRDRLDRLADRGRCERINGPGTDALFRHGA